MRLITSEAGLSGDGVRDVTERIVVPQIVQVGGCRVAGDCVKLRGSSLTNNDAKDLKVAVTECFR